MMTTPMLTGMRRSLPTARITLLLWPNASPSLLPPSDASESLYDDYLWDDADGEYSGISGFRSYVRLLTERRFDAAISLHGGSRTGIAWRLAGIPIRVGNVRRESALLFNHNHNQHRRTPDRHEVQYNFDLARTFGVDGEPGRMFWPICNNDRDEAAVVLDAAGRDKNKQIIVVNPTHGGSSRSWPADRFVQTVSTLREETGAQVALIGGQEVDNTSVAAAIGPGVLDLTGKTKLSVLAAILESALLHISVDTGTMHLAAAVGAPCVAIFPIAEFWDQRVRWQPWMTDHRVVGPSARCSGCLHMKCKRTQTTCIDSISAGEVVGAALNLLNCKI